MLTLGVIGDFGIISENSVEVSNLVKTWNPDAVLTTGDNIYSHPTKKNYLSIVAKLYQQYLDNDNYRLGAMLPLGVAQKMKGRKRSKFHISSSKILVKHVERRSSTFLPCVGNHDRDSSEGFTAYKNFFQLPTYYSAEFLIPENNRLKVISLNSDQEEDGRFDVTHKRSLQREWLEKELEGSKHFQWIIVTFHHPQLCSNSHPEENDLYRKKNFPFHSYPNVALVFCGHQHIYERLKVNGITNVVIGTSGHTVRKKWSDPIKESVCLDDSGFGALKLEVSADEIKGYYNVLVKGKGGKKYVKIVDEFSIAK